MLTQSVQGSGDGGGTALNATETFLRNLRVLATDQSTEQEVVDGKTVVKAFSTVTLEVTPKIAEKISVAEKIGTLATIGSVAPFVGAGRTPPVGGDEPPARHRDDFRDRRRRLALPAPGHAPRR